MVDASFAVGSIFGIWPGCELIGRTGHEQVDAGEGGRLSDSGGGGARPPCTHGGGLFILVVGDEWLLARILFSILFWSRGHTEWWIAHSERPCPM